MNLNELFAPLGKQYCKYFYFLTVFFFALFVFSCLSVLSTLFNKGSLKMADSMILITQPLLLYFINRLYYSMCMGSLN